MLLVIWLLGWWLKNRKRFIAKYRELYLDNQPHPHIVHRTIWYLTKADKSLAWLVAITASLRIIASLP
ncbi:Cdc6-related protein [Vibrio astriarenae]|nr:Cdc6-related protein [Vibrio sp. C7]